MSRKRVVTKVAEDEWETIKPGYSCCMREREQLSVQRFSRMMAVERLAEAREETVDEVLGRFSPRELSKSPSRFSKHLPAVTAAVRAGKLVSTGVRDGLAYSQLDSGRVFYSYLSSARLRREYRFIADTLPSYITEDTYRAVIDVVQRYITDFAWLPEGLVSTARANIIELGAYLGHKTIRFAEDLAGDGGRILAVEMMPGNCEILRRNVIENGFGSVIEVRDVGVWHQPGTVQVFSKGCQRNSILPIEKLADGNRLLADVETLDQIIDRWNVHPIDLVFVTVNGVEVEALQGFHPQGRDVKAFFIAAPYSLGQTANADLCRTLLAECDYRLIDVGNSNRVVAERRTDDSVTSEDPRVP